MFLAIPSFLSDLILQSSQRGRRKPLGNPRGQHYFCTVVSEDVTIALKRKRSLSGLNDLFVRCNERDCQYVDVNEPPCPLRLDLFAEEIEKREKEAEDRRMGL